MKKNYKDTKRDLLKNNKKLFYTLNPFQLYINVFALYKFSNGKLYLYKKYKYHPYFKTDNYIGWKLFLDNSSVKKHFYKYEEECIYNGFQILSLLNKTRFDYLENISQYQLPDGVKKMKKIMNKITKMKLKSELKKAINSTNLDDLENLSNNVQFKKEGNLSYYI